MCLSIHPTRGSAIALIIEDCRAHAILTTLSMKALLPDVGAQIICVDEQS